MRQALGELAPEWLADSPGRERMGFSFLCPACQRHRVEVWAFAPLDGEGPVTASAGRQLHDVFGEGWHNLEVHGALRCGAEALVVHDGGVFYGED